VGSDEQDDDDEEEKSNKKKIDQWAEVKKNPAGWELTTVKGITVKIADAITLPSGKKTYTVIKADGSVSGPINPDLIALVGKVKSSTKTPAAEVPAAKPEIPPAKPEDKPETELSQESKKLYRSLDAVSGETLGRILSLRGEYKTIHGGASDLMAIYKFASPELQDKIKKNVKGASEILTQIPAIKQKYDSITVEQAGTILSNVFTEFDNQNARENQAKIDKSKESSVAAPAPEPQKITTPEEQTDEQKALAHIKQKIKNAATLGTKQIQVKDLYKTNLVDTGNIVPLMKMIKDDQDLKKIIKSIDMLGGKILLAADKKARPESEAPSKGELDISKLKLGGETDEEEPPEDEDGEGPPEDEIDGEPEQEVPRVPKKVGKKGSKEPKQAAPVEDLEGIKKKATSILKKYAKKEGKEGKDLKTFIENIEKAENKAAIVQIFDIVLEEGNAFKASEELNGDNSKKAEAAPTGPEIDATESQPEPEMTPKKLEYGKKQVEKILGTNGVKISSDVKKALGAAEDESGLRDVLFDNLEDATEAKMELTKALEDYDSKQVQKESITRPMFVLKEGIFRLNRY
jgi:Xaa-Pro aminopeptidase